MAIDVPRIPYHFGSEPYPQWTDLYNRLLKERIIFLGKELDDEVASQMIAVMLYLDSEDPSKDMRLQINSPGGSLTAGLAIADTIQQLKSDVVTLCLGLAASTSSLLLALGTPGKRLALPHARIRLHQPRRIAQKEQACDIEIEAREIQHLRRQVNEIYAQQTGQPLEKIEKDTEQGLFMSADEAVEYGLVDRVIEAKKTERK